jgi:hypothetical protein
VHDLNSTGKSLLSYPRSKNACETQVLKGTVRDVRYSIPGQGL